MNHSTKLYNGQLKAKNRRLNTIKRLEEQLRLDRKPLKASTRRDLVNLVMDDNKVEFISPLAESDRRRIEKELAILKTRI